MRLGPRGKPTDINHQKKGIEMGNLGTLGMINPGPPEMGMEGTGFRINKIGEMEGVFGGGMENIEQFESRMNMERTNEIVSNTLKREDIISKQGGDGSRGRASVPGMERMGPGIEQIRSAGMEGKGTGLWHGMDQVGSEIEHMGLSWTE